MHPIFRQTLVSRIDGLAHVIWFNGKCRGNHVSLWIFSFKAKGSGGYPAQQRSNWVVDLFLPFTKNLNTIGEKHPMFQGGKPRQTSETIRYRAPKTIGKVFDVFESSVGLADEAFVGARPICLGWMWYPALAATWFQVRPTGRQIQARKYILLDKLFDLQHFATKPGTIPQVKQCCTQEYTRIEVVDHAGVHCGQHDRISLKSRATAQYLPHRLVCIVHCVLEIAGLPGKTCKDSQSPGKNAVNLHAISCTKRLIHMIAIRLRSLSRLKVFRFHPGRWPQATPAMRVQSQSVSKLGMALNKGGMPPGKSTGKQRRPNNLQQETQETRLLVSKKAERLSPIELHQKVLLTHRGQSQQNDSRWATRSCSTSALDQQAQLSEPQDEP